MNNVIRVLTGQPAPDMIEATKELLEWESFRQSVERMNRKMLCLPHLMDNKSCSDVGCENDGLF